jgi:hypothetical protein
MIAPATRGQPLADLSMICSENRYPLFRIMLVHIAAMPVPAGLHHQRFAEHLAA